MLGRLKDRLVGVDRPQRREQYENESKDGFEALGLRLELELKNSVSGIATHDVLSAEWYEQIKVFTRLATITTVEQKLSSGRKEENTLWETEEQALRFLVEEGKLLPVLRLLVAFKERQREDPSLGGATQEEIKKCEDFEKAVGSVLCKLWSYVEGLQMTEIPLLITYVASVVDHAVYSSAGGILVRSAATRGRFIALHPSSIFLPMFCLYVYTSYLHRFFFGSESPWFARVSRCILGSLWWSVYYDVHVVS
jgi:hypothetical protein